MNGVAISSIDHDIGPDGLVVLKARGGTIRLFGVDGDIVRVRLEDPDDLDRLVVERGPDSISIAATHGRSPDLEIDVPSGATIVAEGGSTDLLVDGLHGDQRYRTVSGELRLRRVQGPIAVDAVSGDIDIVADGRATVTARTVSGDLALRAGPLDSLQATTTSGDLRIAGRLDGDGPFALETVSGEATLAPAGDVRVEVSTITGDVRSEVASRVEGSRGLRSVIIGTGNPTLTFRSTSGDLRIVAAVTIPTQAGAARAPVAASPDAPAAQTPPAPPAPLAPPDAPGPSEAPTTSDPADDERLEILRALERGEIDIDEASRRLAAADDGADRA